MITAADVMTHEVTTVSQDENVEGLIHLFRVSHFTAVPVIDDGGKAVGLVSETDILRAVAYALSPPGSSDELPLPEKDPSRDRGATTRLLRPFKLPGFEKAMQHLIKRSVRDLMSPVLHSCKPETPLQQVCESMSWKGVHRIIVLDPEGKVVGLISALDAVRRFGKELEKQS
jgi:CBS-domain-containing membrane protein